MLCVLITTSMYCSSPLSVLFFLLPLSPNDNRSAPVLSYDWDVKINHRPYIFALCASHKNESGIGFAASIMEGMKRGSFFLKNIHMIVVGLRGAGKYLWFRRAEFTCNIPVLCQ